jgi:hypothetical protein
MGGTCSENGSLILSLDDGPGRVVIVRSIDSWSLADSWAFVEVPEVVTGGAASNMFLILLSDNTLLQWWYESGTLFANYHVDGTLTNVATLQYSPRDHRWWGFFERRGTVTFATSADGEHWTRQGSVPDPFPLTSIFVQFNANGFGEGPHGRARYNNFNVSADDDDDDDDGRAPPSPRISGSRHSRSSESCEEDQRAPRQGGFGRGSGRSRR